VVWSYMYIYMCYNILIVLNVFFFISEKGISPHRLEMHGIYIPRIFRGTRFLVNVGTIKPRELISSPTEVVRWFEER